MRNPYLIVGANSEPARRWLASTLEHMGAAVEQAFCGWELLRLLSVGRRVDLVLIDIDLTSPSGLRTLAIARTIGVEVPFLLVADPADFEVRTAAARLGARVLGRTLSAEELARKVRTTYRRLRPNGSPWSTH